MGHLAALQRSRPILEMRASIENPNTSLSNPAAWLWDALGAHPTDSGVRVSEHTSWRMTTVLACVRVRAETLAQVPISLMRPLKPNGHEVAEDDPRHYLLHHQPNRMMPSFPWREVGEAHETTWGNHYSEIEFDNGGRPIALWPLLPDRTRAELVTINGRREKIIVTKVSDRPGGPTRPVGLPADRVLHIPGLGFDGIRGYSPIALARQAIGLGVAQEEFAARWFGNGSRAAGVLTHPHTLSEPAQRRLRESLDMMHQGLSNSHRMMLLEEGMQWQSISVPPNEAQFLESRQFQVMEICRIFRVPPHLVQDLSRSTNNNIEHQSLDFVIYTMKPVTRRWESWLDMQLLTTQERATGWRFKFNLDELLQGDAKAVADALAIERQNGAITTNEWRAKKGMNPIPAKDGGDELIVQVNMISLKALSTAMPASKPEVPPGADPADPPADTASEPDTQRAAVVSAASRLRAERQKRSLLVRKRYRDNFRGIIASSAAALVGMEVKAGQRLIAKHRGADELHAFVSGMTAFYSKDFGPAVRRKYAPILAGLSGVITGAVQDELDTKQDIAHSINVFAGSYLQGMEARHVGISQGQVAQVIAENPGSDAWDALDTRLGEWDETRADKIGDSESVRAASAFAREAYALLGVSTLVWAGGSCPLCASMNGRETDITKEFLVAGDSVGGDDGEGEPLTVEYSLFHPPLHGGCDCDVVAG